MPLHLEAPEVDRLVGQLADRRYLPEAEVVREALRREWERVEGEPALVEKGLALVRALHKETGGPLGPPADKTFIDSLYEN